MKFIQAIKETHLYAMLRNWETKRRWPGEYTEWVRKGMPIPVPHLAKQIVLREYAQKYGTKVLVETGTCYGDMVAALQNDFSHIYSIELSKYLYDKCVWRFRRTPHVTLMHGDSGVELKKIVDSVTQPAIFWLDGHYSAGCTAKGEKETPIYEELAHVLRSEVRRHVIVIDDARCFGTDPAYPSIDELSDFIKSIRDDLDIAISGDSIRLTPKDYWIHSE